MPGKMALKEGVFHMGKDRFKKTLNKMNRSMEKEDVRDLDRLSRGKKHTFRNAMIILAALSVLSLAAAFFVLDVPNWQTLDMDKLINIPQTGAIYDMDGHFVTRIQSSQHRFSIPLSLLPEHVKNAFLAAEDLRFYSHSGFDPIRILGAVSANIRSGSYEQGASTITQQLIKLSHLSNKKTLARKAEEIWLSIQLENMCTKDEILEMYLNFIYFGKGAYGIEAAAKTYFGISASKLSPAQAACLAAIIKAPSAYAPHLAPDANRTRREYILRTMAENNMLSQETYLASLNDPLTLAPSEETTRAYGWYSDAVLDEAQQLLSLSADALLSSGYHIFTVFSPQMQDILDQQFQSSANFPADAADGEKVQGAMAAVDVNSGAVRAIVGGRSYQVQRGLNRATQLKRQPGSALKPLAVFAPALQSHGYMTASVLDDTPRKFGNYSPRNSGHLYYGNVTIRTALKNSLNVATVSLLDAIGIPAARDYLTKVGIPLDERDANLSLALGSLTWGVSPVQLAASYAPFANGGTFYPPYFIEKILDAQGNAVLDEAGNQTCNAANGGALYLGAGTVFNMYGGEIMERGTVKEIFNETKHPYTSS